ncbi:hypothetical protein KM043_017845 [Ampulex compressa]|nr:hypothetical protein KM043_017845 [Ampulex compressa]
MVAHSHFMASKNLIRSTRGKGDRNLFVTGRPARYPKGATFHKTHLPQQICERASKLPYKDEGKKNKVEREEGKESGLLVSREQPERPFP